MAIVGIDLGTTNSLVAVMQEGKVIVIPNAVNSNLTPSVISISNDGSILVGEAARDRLVSHPNVSVGNIKRVMGSESKIKLGNLSFRPEELSALILRSLKADAEAFLGEPVTEAVISVPAYFNAAQRKATEIAGRLAGLKVERLINEPTAAALAYGFQNNKTEHQFLILDLGGGTFDVTVLETFSDIMEVRATAEDSALGGEDFTELLEVEFYKINNLVPTQLTLSEKAIIRRAVEFGKRKLIDLETVEIKVELDNRKLLMVLDRDKFEEYVKPLIARLLVPMERALRDSSLAPDQLHQVILVGGSTRMLLIKKLVAKLFKRFPLSNISVDEVVAMGAAVQGALKARDLAVKDIVLTDVAPYTLGIDVSKRASENDYISHGIFSPIIERNTVVPVSREETYCTLSENQESIKINIYQGESRTVDRNIKIGELTISVPKGPAGAESICVRFSYDINGLLEVSVKANSSGETKIAVIERAPGQLSPDEINQALARLSNLKIHPRELTVNKTVLARAERLFEELIGIERQKIGEWIENFNGVIAAQDERDILRAREILVLQLSELDKSFFN